jgi:hypothetical protein
VAPGDLSRQELIELVERIMAVDASTTQEEDDRLVQLFHDSVVHPAATDLIFYPDKYLRAPRRSSSTAFFQSGSTS